MLLPLKDRPDQFFVHAHKHSGTYFQFNGGPAREVQARVAHAKKAWGPLVKSLWVSPNVHLQTKHQLF